MISRQSTACGCHGVGAGIVVETGWICALRCVTASRSGGDPAVAIRRTRTWTPRRMVALLDISGSMEPYARAYLHLLWGMATRARAEVFVFGTRLTRLTRALQNGNPDLALERAAAPDARLVRWYAHWAARSESSWTFMAGAVWLEVLWC